MADSKLADLTATTALDDNDLLYVVRDPAGTPVDRKITVANLGASLFEYPTLTWDQYNSPADYHTIAANDLWNLPFDTTDGAVLVNPAAWTIDSGNVYVPAGVYAVAWYWEALGSGDFWRNVLAATGSTLSGAQYMAAPNVQPGAFFGGSSITIKLQSSEPNGNYFNLAVQNRDSSPHQVANTVTISRLDA